jgi:peptidyl-prolyl cis-trans isomerase C
MQSKLTLSALAAAVLLSAGCEQPGPSVTGDRTAAPHGLQAAENQPASAPSQENLRDQVLVTVNGKPITGEMFGLYYNERIQRGPASQNSPQMQNQAINELINIVVLAQEATREGLENRPDVLTALALQRDQLLSRLALQEHISKNPPSEEALKQAYEERYVKQQGEEYKARHILVKSEEEAKQLIGELDAGADFAELAKQHSTGPTGKNGGDLGWFEAGQMVPPFAEALQSMEPGSVASEPVNTQFGWHVIKLEDKRKKEPAPFETVRSKLVADAQRQALADYVNQLREQAQVDINESLVNAPSTQGGESKGQEASQPE